MPRRYFKWFVFLAVLFFLTAVGWLLHAYRHTLEAHWCWYKWTHAATEAEEAKWREKMFSNPDIEDKIAVAVAKASHESPRQSYWVVSGRAAKNAEVFECWARLFVAEAAHNPAILRLRIHALRWSPPTDRPNDSLTADSTYAANTDQLLTEAATTELVWPSLQAVLPFVELCGLTGHFDLARDVNESNWRDRFEIWHKWFLENGPYLRWDEQQASLVVDLEARRTKQSVPAKNRQIPPIATPLPNWYGSNPE